MGGGREDEDRVMRSSLENGFARAFSVSPAAARVRAAAYRHLAQGEPVSFDVLATTLGVSVPEVKDVLQRITPSNLECDSAGRMVAFGGLTLKPTAHEFEVDGKTLHTWCAFDTLFIPGLLGKRARVRSTCPVSGRRIGLEVGLERLDACEPEGAFVSLVLPDAETLAGDVRGTFCCHVHFFASEDQARVWISDHGGAFVLPVAEAFELARSTFGARLA